MSTQSATSVAITGGSINGTTIGAVTPTTGAFTYVTASGPITGSLSAGAYSFGSLAYSDTGIFGSYNISTNSYAQIILANGSNGTAASTDFIVGNNNTTSTTYFGDFGMNSSGFSGSGAFNAPNNVFLSSTSADLAIGTTTANAIHFVVNGSTTDAMTISSGGTPSANQFVNPAVAVTVAANAGTVPVTSKVNNFTNSSAATMAITLATTGAVDGQQSMVRIYDFSAVAQTIGWTNTENSLFSVPTTSNGSTTLPLTVGFQYNGQTSKWRCIGFA